MYIQNIAWRTFYILVAYIRCIMTCIYYGEFMLEICLEPWCNEWEMDTMQYHTPNEVWHCYIALSILFSTVGMYPVILLHIITYLSNRIRRRVRNALIKFRVSSLIAMSITLYIRVECQTLGLLMDISHFDEDVEIVYVPSLARYVYVWSMLFIFRVCSSQIPVLWWYSIKYAIECSKDKNDVYVSIKIRLLYIVRFLIPSIRSAFTLFDDILIGMVWVVYLRIMYLILMYMMCLYNEYTSIVITTNS